MAKLDHQYASAGSLAETEASCTECTSTTWIVGWLSTMKQLANIACVPAEERAYLRRKIADTVSYANLDRRTAEDPLILLQHVFEARSLIAKAAIELQSTIADYDEAYGKSRRCVDAAPQPIDKLLNDILSWQDSPCLLTLAVAYDGTYRGRPSEKTSDLWLFAILLTIQVENAGGRLTFDKNYPTDSSLVRALELLRPYVPWLIPQVVPIRTLVAVRSAAKKGFEGCVRALLADGKMTVEAAEGLLKSRAKRLTRQGTRTASPIRSMAHSSSHSDPNARCRAKRREKRI
jgi:hypothetical protein